MTKTKPDACADAIRALLGLSAREEGARDYIELLEKRINRQRNWARYLESRNGPECKRINTMEQRIVELEALLRRALCHLNTPRGALEHDIQVALGLIKQEPKP